MSIPSVRLMPQPISEPLNGHIPYERALRWVSPMEDDWRDPAVSVFVSQTAYVHCCVHAESDLDNEVGGWLVGKWRVDVDSGEQYIVVDACLPAPHTRQGDAFLTFTQETQIALFDEMEARYPDRELVGWYHTHPRMGIFLSSYDTWLHRNFFPGLYQVALVIEPYSVTGGFFIRELDGSLDPRQYYGFYELHNNSERSVVHWRNLLPIIDLFE